MTVLQTVQSHSLSELYKERSRGIESLDFCSIAAKKSSFLELALAQQSSRLDSEFAHE